jgi:putative addiction module CopG family antidote
MQARKITLPESLDAFVERAVASGEFGDADAVVAEGLRLLACSHADRADDIAWLRAAVAEAELSGAAAPFSIDDLQAQLDSEAAGAAQA